MLLMTPLSRGNMQEQAEDLEDDSGMGAVRDKKLKTNTDNLNARATQ
jgi:hypothetical protein